MRFLDNFSAGTRGSLSTEHFLRRDYAVVFLHRQFSLEPYSRAFTHSKSCFLDLLEGDDGDEIRVNLKTPDGLKLCSILREYQSIQAKGTLLKIDFVTVNEYLFLLRGITQALAQVAKDHVLYYLAAAVSDFYIPPGRMVYCLARLHIIKLK